MTPRQDETKPAPRGPLYQLGAEGLGRGQISLEIWQLPAPDTPRLSAPERVAGLRGRALEIIETQTLKRLRHAGIRLPDLAKGETSRHDLPEDLALTLALLFRALAPMRSIDRIRAVADGIQKLTREEAGYWLGMAIHRSRPRRVLAALRILLTSN